MFCDDSELVGRERRSRSAQDLTTFVTRLTSPVVKLPMPPRLWFTDVSNESSDESDDLPKDNGMVLDRHRMRTRFRAKHKHCGNVPIGFFWDIENCQVPRGCSAIDVVAAIRAKFLPGRREVDFVVVCDVRKELPLRLQELNDAQVSLIHVCCTQKNAADEKLRQCMRRFGELHAAPAALVLISGDINFASDLSDFRHRKNMEVILVHKQNTSSALIACATVHYNFCDITGVLPRRNKNNSSQSEPDEDCTCELLVSNLPLHHAPERVSKRLRRLADNCGGKVIKVTPPTALLRFPTPDHTCRALKRMNGEDVFGRRISTRNVRGGYVAPAYSSDEGYCTAPAQTLAAQQRCLDTFDTLPSVMMTPQETRPQTSTMSREWAMALQQLPNPVPTTAMLPSSTSTATILSNSAPTAAILPNHTSPPAPLLPNSVVIKPRKIRGTHGSSLDQSGSSFNSVEDSRFLVRENGSSRAVSPWNSSASFSEQSSDGDSSDSPAELTVTNLPNVDANTLQDMLQKLFSQYVNMVNLTIWGAGEGAIATVVLKSEWDARLLIARIHKRRLENQWGGRRLELSLGRPSPALNADVLRARLKAILLEQPNHALPLIRLRDSYASRHCCALTTSDIARVRDTVVIHDNFGRVVQLIDSSPATNVELEDTTWRCNIHGSMNMGQDDGSRILAPVYMELSVLYKHTQMLLETHGGTLPLLSFVDCYEATFSPLVVDANRGVSLELLLRSIPRFTIVDTPLRHITWSQERNDTPSPVSLNSEWSRERDRPRTAPCLEPMLSLFEREIVDLLKTTRRCTIPFSKLIPAFHHHFGRQCRVADYGFTKLPDLLAALTNTIVVLGSGSSRVITMSSAAQARRWTSDLVKLLKVYRRPVYLYELPNLYQENFGRPFVAADYGVCTLSELLLKIPPQTIVICTDGSISLPKRMPTDMERARTVTFATEAVELLCYTSNLRMEFARFVPTYYTHFGKQLKVAEYGCVKLLELFELIPDSVSVRMCGGDRVVHLAQKPARDVLSKRIGAVAPISVASFPAAYANAFGAPPLPDMLELGSVEALIYAAGGCIENMIVISPGQAPRWVTAELTACAVLSSDRSVAKGSKQDFFTTAFKERFGVVPNVQHLVDAGVIQCSEGRVMLTNLWRLVWRVALLVSTQNTAMTHEEITIEYSKRYEPVLPLADTGFKSVKELVRYYREVFTEEEGGRVCVCAGVVVPHSHEIQRALEDFSLYDTPPGQKGSRVFDSPDTSMRFWLSPPASALPAPTALLRSHNKRRTRLATQFSGA